MKMIKRSAPNGVRTAWHLMSDDTQKGDTLRCGHVYLIWDNTYQIRDMDYAALLGAVLLCGRCLRAHLGAASNE